MDLVPNAEYRVELAAELGTRNSVLQGYTRRNRVVECSPARAGPPMYPRPFHYHRARSLKQASSLLAELGPEARLLAGGQSLIPLMKLRLANPAHLVDLNFIPRTSYIKRQAGTLRFGPLTRHAEIEHSDVAGEGALLPAFRAG